jgi:SPP1 gp7 family putative phage head morphogenesis protein
MATWNSEHEKYLKKVDAQALTLDQIMKKYQPDFNSVIETVYKKWATDGVLSQDDMYEMLTSNETRLLKKQITTWLKNPIYLENKQFVNKMERVLLTKRLRRSDFMELHFHKIATTIKYEQHGKVIHYLYNDFLDASRTVARLLNKTFAPVGDDAIYAIIDQKYKGETLTDRMYLSASKMAKRWINYIEKSLGKLGKTIGDLFPSVKMYFSKGDGVARNQFKLEATRINTASKLDAFKKLNVKYLQFIAVMDSVTTTVCKRADLKVIRVDKAVQGENVPPLVNEQFHWCRSTIKVYDIDDRTKS